ncbi:MAG: caspase family protein [Bacteroidales bacterium]|nr:caspase family protein [Bacteroidales bacterium]
MKKLIFITYLLLFSIIIFGQQVIEGRSEPKRFDLVPVYERTLPPNLYVDLTFIDANENGIIESEETANLILKITNKGKGLAQGLIVSIDDNIDDPFFTIQDKNEILFIRPNETKEVTVNIKAGLNVKSAEHKLKINVKEHFGYDMDPAFLVVNTLEYRKSEMSFSGLEIVDIGDGTGAIQEDGLLQAGEQVKTKIVIQNVGQNIARKAHYKVNTTDENIYIEGGVGVLGDIGIGEIKEIWIKLSPNKRVNYSDNLPIYLNLYEENGYGNLTDLQLPLKLNQKPPETKTFEIKVDVEKFKNQVAQFEYTSNKFKANIGNLTNIRQINRSKTKRENSVAVVIGVENYDNLPPAPYASNDAEIIESYFKDKLGISQVVTYTNEEVNGFAFDDIFNPDYGELQKSILKGETDLFVFYSGHGMPSKDGKDVYLFPSDGKIERLQTQGYNVNKLYESLNKLEAKSVTVFMDACFSGSSRSSQNLEIYNLVSMKGVRINPKTEQPWVNNKNFTVFTSSSLDETSLGFDTSQTGLFTYYLCAGMQGEADYNKDRKITMGEIQEYVIKNVVETSKKIRGLQTPEFHGNLNQVLIEY